MTIRWRCGLADMTDDLGRRHCWTPYGQYWTEGQTHHLFGDTTQEYVLQPSTAACAHDNEVNIVLLSDAHNRFRWLPASDFHFPGTLEGLWHEVVELC